MSVTVITTLKCIIAALYIWNLLYSRAIMKRYEFSIFTTTSSRIILGRSFLAYLRLRLSFYAFNNFTNFRVAHFSERIIINLNSLLWLLQIILKLMLLSLLSECIICVSCGRKVIIIESGYHGSLVLLMFPNISRPIGPLFLCCYLNLILCHIRVFLWFLGSFARIFSLAWTCNRSFCFWYFLNNP